MVVDEWLEGIKNRQSKVSTMEAHSKDGSPVKIEQVISVALCGDKAAMQDFTIKGEGGEILNVKGGMTSYHEEQPKPNSVKTRPTVFIKGAFEAVNLLTGETHISGQLILPDSGSGYLVAQLGMNPGKLVRIDVTVSCVRAPKSAVGYKYEITLNSIEVAE